MARASMTNFHLPLPSELYTELKVEAARVHRPATELARLALEEWLKQRQRQAVHDEIAAFAKEYAGTDLDLDPDLEAAGIECLLKSERSKR